MVIEVTGQSRSLGGGAVAAIGSGAGSPGSPLIVAIHGGGYTSAYFDLPGHSLLELGQRLGFPVYAVDRPGYGASRPFTTPSGYAAQAEALDAAVAVLWSEQSEAPGVVLVGHSIGAAVAVHVASRRPAWPLLGLCLHGIGVHPPTQTRAAWEAAPDDASIDLDLADRRALMYGPDGSFDANVLDASQTARASAPVAELRESYAQWPQDAVALARRIAVPVHLRLAEHERLWPREDLDAFAELFTESPRVDAAMFMGSGHNIDHHRLGLSLHLEQLAFAWYCAVRESDG